MEDIQNTPSTKHLIYLRKLYFYSYVNPILNYSTLKWCITVLTRLVNIASAQVSGENAF